MSPACSCLPNIPGEAAVLNTGSIEPEHLTEQPSQLDPDVLDQVVAGDEAALRVERAALGDVSVQPTQLDPDSADDPFQEWPSP